MSVVRIERDGDLAVVTVDNPPVNALSASVRQGLWDAAETLDADPGIRGVVLICAGRTFIAGADVTEFGKPPVPPHLPDLVNRIEAAAKPWIAAIHGSALGGGFEVALGCRVRVAAEGASVGLPEVNLGIVPGASGTVRTPRLAGVAAAVELITTGKPVKAAKARAMGLIDAIVPADLRAGALAFARQALEVPLPAPVSARPVTAPDESFWTEARARVAKAAKGAAAPLRALECIRKAAEAPLAEALAFERQTFLDLRGSDQSAALR
ncbi:MAG: enoyl-CoA hydratase/isomerase family protein, partial [Paracoccaceae bacterium]|nr:enoyl-CoA hydratase/isomerase family protein [Paracoccaceae bacterium]